MAALVIGHSGHDVDTAKHHLSLLARGLGAADPRSMDQREADLAIDLLTGRLHAATPTSRLEQGEPPQLRRTHPRCRTHVNVSIPIQTLIGVGDAPGQSAAGQPIPASLARRIAAQPDSTWFRLLTDPAGNLADLSTHAYRPSEPLWRTTSARDRVCIAPGCASPAGRGDADHTRPYPHGDTSHANLGHPCRHDHQIKHSPGIFLTQPEPGVIVWRYPTGHTHTTRARPHPVTGWPEDDWLADTNATELRTGLQLLRQRQAEQTQSAITHVKQLLIEARLAQWRHDAGDPDDPDPPFHDPEHIDLEPTPHDNAALDQMLRTDAA